MSAVPCPAALDTPTGAKPGVRNLAIDSYRGLVMLLMMAEVLELAHVSAAFPGNAFGEFRFPFSIVVSVLKRLPSPR